MMAIFIPIPVPILLVMLTLMTGCAVTPGTIVQTPPSSATTKSMVGAPTHGAIFQAGAYRPMFEDRRARIVGDILTITIAENTSASKSVANSGSKTGEVEASATALFGAAASVTGRMGAETSTSNKFEDKGAASASNTFTGTIGVTVIDVLPNGNLLVSGEKQIAFDKGAEYIRFSGVVNPDSIVAGNKVSSTQVADARFEYRTNSRLDRSEWMSILTRFFLSVIPM